MTPHRFLDAGLAVTGKLAPDDFAALARQGFRSVISNRIDGEEPGQLTAWQEAALAWRAGLTFRHVPAAKHEVLDADFVDALSEALAAVPGPVLLHCKSGMRSTIIWAAVVIRDGRDIEEVLAAAKAAGFDLEAVRQEILESAANGLGLPDCTEKQGCMAAA